jgi:hypothetical protein
MTLIDAEKYYDDVTHFAKAIEANGVDTSLIYAVVIPWLLKQSEVEDAEVVVRCEKCKFHEDKFPLVGYPRIRREPCQYFGGVRMTEDDGFCKWGERKGKENEVDT